MRHGLAISKHGIRMASKNHAAGFGLPEVAYSAVNSQILAGNFAYLPLLSGIGKVNASQQGDATCLISRKSLNVTGVGSHSSSGLVSHLLRCLPSFLRWAKPLLRPLPTVLRRSTPSLCLRLTARLSLQEQAPFNYSHTSSQVVKGGRSDAFAFCSWVLRPTLNTEASLC